MQLLRKTVLLISLVLTLLIVQMHCNGQELPPRPLKVTTFQNLSFGALIVGLSGGTLTITPEGSRIAVGEIFPVNMNQPYYPAIFEVEALPGNLIHISLPVYATLTGTGQDITLVIDSSLPETPFINTINPPFKTQVRVGGTITVDNSNTAGNYFGTFSVTFIQE